MYICICNRVTDSDIRTAVRNGVSTMRELRFATGCASQCGSCACDAKAVLTDALDDADHPSSIFTLLNAQTA